MAFWGLLHIAVRTARLIVGIACMVKGAAAGDTAILAIGLTLVAVAGVDEPKSNDA